MYFKALTAERPRIPMLFSTIGASDLVRFELEVRGWADAATAEPALAPDSELVIDVGRSLALSVGGAVLFAESDAAGPRGWWPAVRAHGGTCIVAFAEPDAIDLASPDKDERLSELSQTPGGLLWAVVRVRRI